MTRLTFMIGGQEASIPVDTVIVAGWTGRDRAAVEAHIAELESLGIARPSTAPVFYRVSSSRLTLGSEIESTSPSSGEVEAVLLAHDDRLWVGVGSDHTDREVEKVGVAISKQLCDKPVAPELWPYDEVADHWDQLVLRSWIDRDVLYQEGTLDALLPPDELLAIAQPGVKDGTLMFCGTVPALGGIRPASAFRFELEDPVRGAAIGGHYSMRPLPLIS